MYIFVVFKAQNIQANLLQLLVLLDLVLKNIE